MGSLVISLLGLLCVGLGLSMLAPMAVALYYREAAWAAFLKSAVLSCGLGLILFWVFREKEARELGHREGMAIVGTSWFLAGLLGGVPLFLSGDFNHLGGPLAAFTGGVFEAISGFTTTGASVLTDVTGSQKSVLFWRALTHWFGGMGFIVLSLAILPLLGVGGMQLYKAEVPSPTPDKLQPRVKDTAKLLWKVYALLTAGEVVLLMLGGMNLFEAVCHAFATMATGGFSTRSESIGFYTSPYLQWVVTVFMLLAGMNFTLHYWMLRGRLGAWWRDSEWRFFMGLYLICALAITLVLWIAKGAGLESGLRLAFFQTATILTTTGFATADYAMWPAAALAFLVVLMFVGGSAGSTGGGPKVMRVMVVLKQCYHELLRLVHPRLVPSIRVGKLSVEPEVVNAVWGFMGLYLATFLLVAVLLTAMGQDLTTSFFASIACLGNIGPGLGAVGPAGNYAQIPVAGQWLLAAAMIVGRLEVFTVLVLLTPEFWRR